MVASGNMTRPNFNNYYSSIILLRSMRTGVLLAELNNIDTRTGDTNNAYLDACTTEKIVFNAVPKFSPFGHAVHLLLIKTSLYDLKSSGARSHYRLSDTLKSLGLVPSMGRCDIWMHN